MSSTGLKSVIVGGAAAALLGGLLTEQPAGAAEDSSPRRLSVELASPAAAPPVATANTPPLVRRTGQLTSRPAGMPTTSEPARRLVSASVTQDLQRGRIAASVQLGAVADRSTESNLWLGFGRLNGNNCNVALKGYVNTRPGSGHLADYGADGSVAFEQISSEARTAIWNCAVVLLALPGDDATQFDALVGPLTDVRAAPAPALSLKTSSAVSLKRKTWKTIRVTVSNPGTGPAKSVRLRTSGSGVKVKSRTVSLGTIKAGASKRAKIRVRVNARNDRRVTVRATSGTVKTSRRIELRPSFKARKPVPGRYKGKNGVSFTITKGRKITQWKASVPQQCGYGIEAWWMTSTLSFPATKIAKNGKVKRTYKRSDHTKKLSALVDGKRVIRGTFLYSHPAARCTGALNWTAKRVGR